MSVNGVKNNPINYGAPNLDPVYANMAKQKPAPEIKGGKDKITISGLDRKSESVLSSEQVDKIKEMLAESNRRAELFREMIERLLQQQAGVSFGFKANNILRQHYSRLGEFFAKLEVDDATQKWAEEQISEDGYWGVKQTSERILNFAKAYAGDDPAKLELMYNAAMAGFGGAQKAWGGEMPSITQQTREAVEKGFQEWRESLNNE
jgi:hypothetical protein